MIKGPLPLHPGKVLLEVYMSQLGLNQTALVNLCGCPPRKISEIVNGTEAWDRLNTEVLEWNKIFVENEDICSIWLSGEEKMTELPVTERMRYQHLFNMSMYTHQSAYSRAKMLDNAEMADHAIESFAETLRIEGGTMQIWKHYNQTDEFGEKINEYLKTSAT